jgi:Na+/melibiose symporter-like transporter
MVRTLPAIVYFILAFILGTLLRAFRHYFIQPYIGYHGALVTEAILILALILLGIILMPRLLAYEKRFGTRMATLVIAFCCILFAGAAFIDVISFIPVHLRVPVFPLGPVG